MRIKNESIREGPLSDLRIQENFELRGLNSWQVGGPAEFFCAPISIEQLQEAIRWAALKKKQVTVLGGGSNVLISDQGIKGLVIGLKDFSKVEFNQLDNEDARGPRWVVQVLAGTSKSELLRIFLKQKLAPAVFLAGIPGDVGGGVVMNAGIGEMLKPREFVEITDWIEVLRGDGKIERLPKDQLRWSYRHCQGWQPGIIVRVGFSWSYEPDDSILVRTKTANQLRLSRQPLDRPSCGSVFVNPEGHKAAMLIDSCGLKGYTLGKAQVSTKHANFIVNLGDATASEISDLIKHVQQLVLEKAKVELKTEVVRLGQW